jgi:hypothetical protein
MMTNSRNRGCCQYIAGWYHTTQGVLLAVELLLEPLLLLRLAVAVAARLLPGSATPWCLFDGICWRLLRVCNIRDKLGAGSGMTSISTRPSCSGAMSMWKGSPVSHPQAKKTYTACVCAAAGHGIALVTAEKSRLMLD